MASGIGPLQDSGGEPWSGRAEKIPLRTKLGQVHWATSKPSGRRATSRVKDLR
jgi:hypothetical protein